MIRSLFARKRTAKKPEVQVAEPNFLPAPYPLEITTPIFQADTQEHGFRLVMCSDPAGRIWMSEQRVLSDRQIRQTQPQQLASLQDAKDQLTQYYQTQQMAGVRCADGFGLERNLLALSKAEANLQADPTLLPANWQQPPILEAPTQEFAIRSGFFPAGTDTHYQCLKLTGSAENGFRLTKQTALKKSQSLYLEEDDQTVAENLDFAQAIEQLDQFAKFNQKVNGYNNLTLARPDLRLEPALNALQRQGFILRLEGGFSSVHSPHMAMREGTFYLTELQKTYQNRLSHWLVAHKHQQAQTASTDPTAPAPFREMLSALPKADTLLKPHLQQQLRKITAFLSKPLHHRDQFEFDQPMSQFPTLKGKEPDFLKHVGLAISQDTDISDHNKDLMLDYMLEQYRGRNAIFLHPEPDDFSGLAPLMAYLLTHSDKPSTLFTTQPLSTAHLAWRFLIDLPPANANSQPNPLAYNMLLSFRHKRLDAPQVLYEEHADFLPHVLNHAPAENLLALSQYHAATGSTELFEQKLFDLLEQDQRSAKAGRPTLLQKHAYTNIQALSFQLLSQPKRLNPQRKQLLAWYMANGLREGAIIGKNVNEYAGHQMMLLALESTLPTPLRQTLSKALAPAQNSDAYWRRFACLAQASLPDLTQQKLLETSDAPATQKLLATCWDQLHQSKPTPTLTPSVL